MGHLVRGVQRHPSSRWDDRRLWRVDDQAALYGVLQKVRNVGLPLISVNRMESD
jgi:hypothetical protein